MNRKLIYLIIIIVGALNFHQINSNYISIENITYGIDKTSFDGISFIVISLIILVYIFYFSGNASSNLKEYGYLHLIRNKKAKSWYNRYLTLVIRDIFIIFLIQNFIYYIFNYNVYSFKGMFLYSIYFLLTMFLIINTMIYLETFFQENIVLLQMFLWIAISFFISAEIYTFQMKEKILYLLIPIFGFANQTNMIDQLDFGLNSNFVLIELILLNIIMYFLVLNRINRRDII